MPKPPITSLMESTRVLLDRASGGDNAALAELYDRYLPALQRWAHGRLPRWARDAVETDDLVQDTLLKTLERVDAFEPDHSGAFQAYVRQTLLNRIRDEIRRAARRPLEKGGLGDLRADAASPVEEAIGREALERYETALLELRPLEREAVLARVELGLPYAEVAAITGQPSADAARMTVSRALKRLAQKIADA